MPRSLFIPLSPSTFFEFGGTIISISPTILGCMMGLTWLRFALCLQGLKPQQLSERKKKKHQLLLPKPFHSARSYQRPFGPQGESKQECSQPLNSITHPEEDTGGLILAPTSICIVPEMTI